MAALLTAYLSWQGTGALIGLMIEPHCEEFLAARVQGVPHSGRGDLFRHLRGTNDLLQEWGNPPSVCRAGLFHSVYGTWHVSYRAATFSERDSVRAVIGEEAEALAYIFCVAERPKDFLECLDRRDVEIKDHHSGEMMRLPRRTLDRLLEIEAANIIDQDERHYGVLEQCLRAWLTPGAVRGIQAYLDEGKRRRAAALSSPLRA